MSDEPIGIEMTVYTDPLCCWTWAMNAHWKALRDELKGYLLGIEYKMGGLLPSWKHFSDQVNSIQKPIQMGPEWLHARVVSGAEINNRIWITDPPSSSFPACIAVKCAEMQSAVIGEYYLFALQEAVMVKNLNIADSNILLLVASSISTIFPDFNLFKFRKDLFGDRGKTAFRKDVQECKYAGINRFPTIIIKSKAGWSVRVTGYQTYESLKRACLDMEKPVFSGV